MVNTRDHRRLWGEQYQRPLANLLIVPEDIAENIAEKLQRRLSRAEVQQRTPSTSKDSEAAQLYLRGRYLLNKRTDESMTRSIEYFERAIEKDPQFALAYAALGECYSQLHMYVPIPRKDARQKARAAGLKALALDDRLGEAHAVVATCCDAWACLPRGKGL